MGRADVIDPQGKHALSLKEASTVQSFKVTEDGFYEVHRANGRTELVAVHADRRESDLAAIPAETLDLWRNTGRGIGGGTSATADSAARPWSLWRYALFLVLLIGLAESLLAVRYLSVEKEAA